MKANKIILIVFLAFLFQACGTLDSKTIHINAGDTKAKVIKILGVPEDRQIKNKQEAWQYCVSGAGFGYNDHKVIWLNSGRVTGITSYKTYSPGCTGAFKTVKWESAPDVVVETRSR